MSFSGEVITISGFTEDILEVLKSPIGVDMVEKSVKSPIGVSMVEKVFRI